MRVTRKQQKQLKAVIARPSAPACVVRRARVILLSAAGASGIDIAVQLDLSPEAVSRIRRRFVEAGVDGLADQPKAGRRDHAVAAGPSSRSSSWRCRPRRPDGADGRRGCWPRRSAAPVAASPTSCLRTA